jgi:uncharacterized protein
MRREGSAAMTEVRDNPVQSRFELQTNAGRPAFSEYRVKDGKLYVLHTEVPEELEGQGIGSKLARGVLEIARERGMQVVPRCPFVSAYIRRHPEYSDLVA